MQDLFTVNVGLMVWTVVTFLLLLAVLAKFGWRPLISALEAREARIKADLDAAKAAAADAQRVKSDLEAQLAGAEAQGRRLLEAAAREGDDLRAKLRADAESDARKIKDKTLSELADEKQRLVHELRREVADLSVLAAERLLRKSVDEGVEKTVLEGFFKDLDKQKARS